MKTTIIVNTGKLFVFRYNSGSSSIQCIINSLEDENGQTIGTPNAIYDYVAVAPCAYFNGDANANGSINIIDALLVAQYYVGLDPNRFREEYADTNCDRNINIVDALLIAQYYVGLISEFCR